MTGNYNYLTFLTCCNIMETYCFADGIYKMIRDRMINIRRDRRAGRGEFVCFQDQGGDYTMGIRAFGVQIYQLREKMGISRKEFREGLCCHQELSRIEKDIWRPDFFIQETLLGRLGIEMENCECFLYDDEADQFDLRMEILENLFWGRIDNAEKLLEEFRTKYAKFTLVDGGCIPEDGLSAPESGTIDGMRIDVDKVPLGERLAMQFYLGAAGQMRRKKKSDEELHDIFSRAVYLTVPGAWEKPLEELVLSINELNLMLEAERYRKGGMRPDFLVQLLEYIERRPFDGRGKAKIYPKAVYFYYLCREERRKAVEGRYLEPHKEEKTELGEKLLQKYCERGLEILRDNGRMYYLWEMLDMREHFLELQIERLSRQNSWRLADLKALLEENGRWKDVLERVYREWQVSGEIRNCCYIYMPKAVSRIRDVILIRRNMLGISIKDFHKDICCQATVQRIERGTSPGRWSIVGKLFQRLGLPGELLRQELDGGSPEAVELLERLRERLHKCYWEDAEDILRQLQGMVDMEMPCNRQVIMGITAIIHLKQEKISTAEYCRLQQEALEQTLPFEVFLRKGEKYLTHMEQTCIQNMMMGMPKESGRYMDCMRAFEELYKPCMEKGLTAMVDGIYALIMGTVGSEYGNLGENDKADLYNEPIIQGSLRVGKLRELPRALYSCWRNDAHRRKQGIPTKKELDDVEEIMACRILCEIENNRNKVLFCQSKLEEL